jgi:hypothetical protein
MGIREDFVTKARAEIGVAEGPKENETKYGAFTKKNFLPWCGSFIMWCAHEVGFKAMPDVVYTPAGVAKFQGMGGWSNAESAKPEPGDIVFFDFVEGGAAVEHVGIVVKDNLDGTVVTVEGNTSPDKKPTGSQANGGEVCMKVRAYKKNNTRKLPMFIVGFGKPKWSK